jgi:uncharacterized coiled-coil DUF342 family protein
MDKTKVDDMLIEMIQPKIIEIEEKFSAGKGLNQEDINTLLLKSQYNHINHLDEKLNDVTNSVVELESKFEILRSDIRADIAEFKTDIQVSINNMMKWYIGGAGVILVTLKALDIFIKG